MIGHYTMGAKGDEWNEAPGARLVEWVRFRCASTGGLATTPWEQMDA